MSEHMMPIPSRLYNAAVGGHVAGADQIIDDETGLTLDKVTSGALEEKEYTLGSDNGMGRVVLRKNLVEEVNTLTQSMINKSNTIYVIQYDFTLGEDITVPANCVLEFDGGSIDGGGTAGLGNGHTITFNNTVVTKQKNAFTNCRFAGTLATQQVFMSTFGVVADGETDDSWVIQDVIDCSYGKSSEVFFDCDEDYIIGSTTHHSSVVFKSNTVYTFTGKGFLKLLGDRYAYTGYGSIAGASNVENVVINNIKIDGNYQFSGGTGENGFSCSNTKNLRLSGGVIKNCMRGQAELINNEYVTGPGIGGKGIQTENYGNQNLIIDNVAFYNCSIAISLRTAYSAGEYVPQIINANNIYAENCPSFVYVGLINATDIDESELCLNISNSIIKNCGWYKYGVADEWHPNDYIGEDPENVNHAIYQDEGSVFTLDRATNLHLTNIVVCGNKQAYNIFGGTHRNCTFNNIVITQPCTTILSLDQGKYNLDYKKCVNNIYDFVINCLFTYWISVVRTDGSSLLNTDNNVLFMMHPIDTTILRGDISRGGLNYISVKAVRKGDSDYGGDSLDTFDGQLGFMMYAPVNGIIENLSKLKIGAYNDKPNLFKGNMWILDRGTVVVPVWSIGNGNYNEYDGSALAIARSGSTSIRQSQIGEQKPVGFVYMDTDINKPCFWNGTKYVLADGTDAPTT